MAPPKTKEAVKHGKTLPTTKPCRVRVKKITTRGSVKTIGPQESATPPTRAEIDETLQSLRQRGIIAQPVPVATIELSSEDEKETPPRPRKKSRPLPATPSPVKSTGSDRDTRANKDIQDDWSWLLASPGITKPDGLPITPGRTTDMPSPGVISVRSTIVGSPGSDMPYLMDILKENPVPATTGQASQATEPQPQCPPDPTPSAPEPCTSEAHTSVSTRQVPQPMILIQAPQSVPQFPMPLPRPMQERAQIRSVVVIPKKVDTQITFTCEHELSPEIVAGLQPHLRAAMALHRPGMQYKRVVSVEERKFRILIGRKGRIIVMPRGQSNSTPGEEEV
ncbi:uncharacterized protein [Musca autumnalis]|uniref:uncharacterized protein n=1 Tax=Musca autumnalis TaxID=221902 RepID=UPI003CF08323